MARWHDFIEKDGKAPVWPYPVNYEKENEIDVDVLVIGGGIAGCWAAISAARTGLKVALAEKGDVIRSGAGGPGCDHWCNAPANPLSNVDPDEWAEHMADRPYCNGVGLQIQNREDWDTLQEMEMMGGKIRDEKDEYVGVIGRDEKSKIMISPRYTKVHSYVPGSQKEITLKSNPERKLNNVVIRVWGSTFKPALKKECKRLGVQVFDRVMITNLLTEKGVQGGRIIGATGLNGRTGEFMIFKSKAAVMATAGDWSLYLLNTELAGYNTFRSRTMTGDGNAMAWRAGAELTMAERTGILMLGTGFKHTWYGGAADASYENVPLVDANGKRLPWPTQGWPDAGAMRPTEEEMQKIIKGIQNGEYELPFFGDFPAMPEVERRTTWHMMLREESTTRNIVDSYEKAGFNPAKHLLHELQLHRRRYSAAVADRERRSNRGLGHEDLVGRSLCSRGKRLLCRGPFLCRGYRPICRPESCGLCQTGGARCALQGPDSPGKNPHLCPDKTHRRHRLERTARRYRPRHAVFLLGIQDG